MAEVAVNYEHNEGAYRRMAASDPDILDACLSEVARGRVFAVSISPHGETGEYADSFKVQPTTVRNVGRRQPRVAAILYNDSGHAAAVEYSNEQQPEAHRVLRRTAAMLGGGKTVSGVTD